MAIDCFYPQIDVVEIVSTGERYPLASTNVEFYNITQGVTIDTIATDAYGILAEGGFDSGVDAAAVGDVVELRITLKNGTARFTLKATQAAAYTAFENDVATYIAADAYTTRTLDAVAVLAQDLSEPDAPPVKIGTVAPGATSLVPFQSGVAKNLRLYLAPLEKEFSLSANDLSQFDTTDLAIPGTSGSAYGLEALFDEYADATTAGVAYEDLYSYSVPAGTLAANGDCIDFEYQGTTAANANNKVFGVTFDNSTVFDSGTIALNDGHWNLRGKIIRVNDTTVRVWAVYSDSSGNGLTNYEQLTVVGLTSNAYLLDLYCRTPDNAGDITARAAKGVFIPAAPVAAADYLTFLGDRLVFLGDPLAFNP